MARCAVAVKSWQAASGRNRAKQKWRSGKHRAIYRERTTRGVRMKMAG